MRRGHAEDAAPGQLLEDGLRQRRALVRVGAGPQLVEQHQRSIVHLLEQVA